MRNFITVLLLTFTMLVAGQNQRTYSFFRFPDKETLGNNRLVKAQYSVWVDTFGEAPNGRGGRHFGVEMTAIMGLNKTAWFYIAPSLSSFPQLEDGYLDVVVSIGTNWHMFNTTAIRYYTGIRLGHVWRKGWTPHPLIGLSAGLDVRLKTFRNKTSIHLGGELFADYRSDQADGKYGDSDAHDVGVIFTNSQVVESGRFKLSFWF